MTAVRSLTSMSPSLSASPVQVGTQDEQPPQFKMTANRSSTSVETSPLKSVGQNPQIASGPLS